MHEEETRSLLHEIAERQKSLEQRLSAIELMQQETLNKYQATDDAYRAELANYQQRGSFHAFAAALRSVARILSLLLLLYVAYRVS